MERKRAAREVDVRRVRKGNDVRADARSVASRGAQDADVREVPKEAGSRISGAWKVPVGNAVRISSARQSDARKASEENNARASGAREILKGNDAQASEARKVPKEAGSRISGARRARKGNDARANACRLASRGAQVPEGHPRGGIFRSPAGGLRLVWLWIIGLAAYFAWNWGVELAFSLVLGRLYTHAVNLRAASAAQTPVWAEIALQGYAPLHSIVKSVGTILIALGLKKCLRIGRGRAGFDMRRMLQWALAGLAAALAGTAICLLTDSLRLELPLSEPGFAPRTALAVPVCLLSAFAGAAFMLGYLYESARTRLRRAPSILLLTAVEFAAGAGWRLGWIGMLNLVLQALICCLLYDRFGLAAPIGLWFGWDFVLSALFVRGSGGVWTVYCVSEAWLTGGSDGLFGGICATVFLLIALAWLRPWRRGSRVGA